MKTQVETVRNIMRDGKFRTIEQLSLLTGIREASVSARLRDLRKAEFGGLTVERVAVGNSRNFKYRVKKLSKVAKALKSQGQVANNNGFSFYM